MWRARLCTRLRWSRLVGAAPIQTREAYSSRGRTKPWYTASMPRQSRTRAALRRRPIREFALAATDRRCMEKDSLESTITPRSLRCGCCGMTSPPKFIAGTGQGCCLWQEFRRSCDLDGSNLTCHCVPHACNALTEACRLSAWCMASSRVLTQAYSEVSSENVPISYPGARQLSASFTYTMNRDGPRMLPCGTPVEIG